MEQPKRRTVVVMMYADGHGLTIYLVCQARIKVDRRQREYWDLNDPETCEVAKVGITEADRPVSYQTLASRFATADAPVWEKLLNEKDLCAWGTAQRPTREGGYD